MTAAPVIDDPFATAEDVKPERGSRWLSGGRYRYPNRDGSAHKGGWTRVTNLVGAIADSYALREWELRNFAAGTVLDPTIYPDLVRLVHEVGGDAAGLKPHQDRVDDLLGRAKAAAGGNEGSDWGTREHKMVEAYHLDLTEPRDLDARKRLRLYVTALAEAQLKPVPGMQERKVMIEWANACGTLDNVLECIRSGWLHIGDLKTQRKFWTWLEVEAQLAGYANATAMWDDARECWTDMPAGLNKEQAAVLWVPNPTRPEDDGTMPEVRAEVRQVDIERGWDTFRLAHKVYTRRSEAKSARQVVSGIRGWNPVPALHSVERYARRFATVETQAEGSALVMEAWSNGAWCNVLSDAASRAAERLRTAA